MHDRIGDFRHTSEVAYFPSWKKGESKRQQILRLLEQNPEISIEEISQVVNLSKSQVKRHRSRLVSDCLWRACSALVVLSSGFLLGAYWADPDVFQEKLDSVICSTEEAVEKAVWAIGQTHL